MCDLFVVDTQGNEDFSSVDKPRVKSTFQLPKQKLKKLGEENHEDAKVAVPKTKSKTKTEIDSFCQFMGWGKTPKAQKKESFPFPDLKFNSGKVIGDITRTDVSKEMEKSVLNNIELVENLQQYTTSDKKLQKLRKVERDKTKGSSWFNLPATEVTEEIKKDLEILQMRSALDPKHFYKKNDLKVLPKYFQMGKVLDTPLDYYNDKGAKKNNKRTMVDELMADAEFQRFNKKKYGEIMQSKQKKGYYKANKKMKKLKKKK